MLGYEPSPVNSQFEISDYSQCAFDLGHTPAQFLQLHNPMFENGREMLASYTTQIPCFNNAHFQILCVNNSSAAYKLPSNSVGWQGVLHTATIPNRDEKYRRIINSTMIASVNLDAEEKMSELELQQFAKTTAVKRRGYDKLHLEDEA